MDEGTMGAVLGLCVACIAIVWLMMEKIQSRFESKIDHAVQEIRSKPVDGIPSIDDIREELEDLIQDTMGQMRTPQIADHIGAMLQQYAQFRMQKEMATFQGLLPTAPDDEV